MELPLLFSVKYLGHIQSPVWSYVMSVLMANSIDEYLISAVLRTERLRTVIGHVIDKIEGQDFNNAIRMLRIALKET